MDEKFVSPTKIYSIFGTQNFFIQIWIRRRKKIEKFLKAY